jgi:hypothetical protein
MHRHKRSQRFGFSRLHLGLLALVAVTGAILWDLPATGATPSVLQDCQAARSWSDRTQADQSWLNQCVHALTPPTSAPTAPPTGSTANPSTGTPAATTPASSPSQSGFPSAANTGVPAGIQLTAKTGDITITTNGTVISGVDLTGCIVNHATNVVIMNSRIHCKGAYGIFNDYRLSTNTGFQVIDTEIDCMGQGGSTGISGHTMTVTRANIHGCENGLDMQEHTSLVDSYIHDLSLVGAGHTDGIQSAYQYVLIQHNTIENTTSGGTSSIITDPTQTANFTITGNLLVNDGGSYVLYCPTSTTNFVVTNNRFSYANAYGYSVHCAQSAVTWSGNVNDSTGAAIKPDTK